MPILYDEDGQAYSADFATPISVEDIQAELDKVQEVESGLKSAIAYIQGETTPATDVTPADSGAPAADDGKSTTDVTPDQPAVTTPDVQPVDVPVVASETPVVTAPTDQAQPTVTTIQDVTPVPETPVTTVDESAQVIATTDSTPQVTTVADASPTPGDQPQVITLQ